MNAKRLMIAHGIAAALCLSACLGLTACTTPPGDPPTSTSAGSSVSSVAAGAQLTGDKAYYAAEAAYVGVLGVIGKAVDNGTIKGETATKVSGYVATAHGLLLQARAAQAAVPASP